MNRVGPASVLAALLLAGCAAEPPAPPQPAFYRDLAGGGTLDAASSLAIINDYRKTLALGPLRWDSGLAAQAEAEARGHAAADSLLTSGTGNARAAGALKRSVSGGYHSFADAFSGWRGSRAHDAVLREASAAAIGIAAVSRPGSRHRVYWVVLVK